MNNQYKTPAPIKRNEPLAPPPQTPIYREAREEERLAEAVTPLQNGEVVPHRIYSGCARRLDFTTI